MQTAIGMDDVQNAYAREAQLLRLVDGIMRGAGTDFGTRIGVTGIILSMTTSCGLIRPCNTSADRQRHKER